MYKVIGLENFACFSHNATYAALAVFFRFIPLAELKAIHASISTSTKSSSHDLSIEKFNLEPSYTFADKEAKKGTCTFVSMSSTNDETDLNI